MKVNVITVGKPQLPFAKDGIEEYTKRLGRFVDVSVHHVKENKDTEQKIINLIGNDMCIILDETGGSYDTKGLAQFLDMQKNHGTNLSFVVGGPDGHTAVLRERGDVMWSLSGLTFPHDIATMLTLEALYRSFSILEHHPYHRD